MNNDKVVTDIKEWKEKCFNEERLRKSSASKNKSDARTAFDNDYSRIINSSALRRLQDKAQVFPLKKGDFVRSRLTHSLEVSHFGHTMGLAITKKLGEKDPELLNVNDYTKLSGILSAAGLVHDFGNPPFGHFGEEVIKQFFKNFFQNEEEEDEIFIFDTKKQKLEKKENLKSEKEKKVLEKIKKAIEESKKIKKRNNDKNLVKDIKDLQREGKHILSRKEINDLCSFDGNAQTFRILSRLQYHKDKYGLNLTKSLLATIIKYPVPAYELKNKFGYFLTEKDNYEEIKNSLNLTGRHPTVYLLEAADDIAYSVADIEDGLKKKIFSKDFILQKLEEKKNKISREFNIGDLDFNEIEIQEEIKNRKYGDFFGFFKMYEQENEEKINKFNIDQKGLYLLKKAIVLLKTLDESTSDFLQDFRIFFQAAMLIEVQDYYVEHLSEILNNYNSKDDKTNILEESSAKYLRQACKEISKKIFNASEILEAEILGNQVLNTLLKIFVGCILKEDWDKTGKYEGKICSLISENYKSLNFKICPYNYLGKYIELDDEIIENHVYNKFRCIIDFISGMTDSFALEIYRKIIYK